jgi:hypothetical protein
MTRAPIASVLRNRYGKTPLSGVQPINRGLVHAYIDDSWQYFASIADIEDAVPPPYVYVVNSLLAKPQSITIGNREFIVADLRMFSHLSLLSKATVNEFSTSILAFVFSRLYTEKLYCATRYRDSAIFHLKSEQAIHRKLFESDDWLNWSVGWQLRFMLAHELCHTVFRLSPRFREDALRITQEFLDWVEDIESRTSEESGSEVDSWFDNYVPQLAKNLGVDDDYFSWARDSAANVPHALYDDGVSSVRQDMSWLEEVTCDIQAALHLMCEMKDSTELTKFCVHVTMALQNLRVVGHFEFLTKLPIDVFADESDEINERLSKEIRDSKLRRKVVALLMMRNDWLRFRVAPSAGQTALTTHLLDSQWSAQLREESLSEERRHAILNIDRRWHENVQTPLLLVYPRVAVRTLEEITQRFEEKISDFANDHRKLRHAIEALYGPIPE